MKTQVKLFRHRNQLTLEELVNDFIKDKYVLDIKQSVAQENSYAGLEKHILVIYQVAEGELE